MNVFELKPGETYQWQERSVRLERYTNGNVELIESNGSVLVVTANEFVRHSPTLSDTPMTTQPLLEDIASSSSVQQAHLRQRLLERAINGVPAEEIRTPEDALYDSECTTLTGRMHMTAAALGIRLSAAWKLLSRYRNDGLMGLLDGRAIFQRRAIPSIQVGPLSDAITTVLLDNAYGSALTRKILRRKITEQLKQDADGKPVPIPSTSAVNRLIGLIEKRLKLQGTPKQRQKRALNPNTPYGHHRATRPGHTVKIDATSFDIFVYDPHTKRWIRVVLLLAVDVYTRSIVAWRFVPVDAKALDAALLLFDMIRPKPALPGWPDEGLWRYFGVPEEIWIMSDEDDELKANGKVKANGANGSSTKPTVAGTPFVKPSKITIDHGKIFVSRTFRHICAMHDISLQLSRVQSPTDKAIVERMFKYISENFAAALPGFKGADLSKRGVDIEAQAYLFIEELDARFAEWVAVHWQNFCSSGLHLPDAPELNLTPNEMYAAGLHIGGFPRTPTNLTYFDCLDTEFHAVTSNGIYARHLYYDSHDLEPYRNTPSTVTLPKRKGKYRIKVDPRDRSTIYFYDELQSNWISIPWRGAAVFPHPFGDLALGYAKALAQRQLLGTKPTDEDLALAMQAQFARWNAERFDDRRERRAYGRDQILAKQSARDRVRHSKTKDDAALTAEAVDDVSSEDTDTTMPDQVRRPIERFDQAMSSFEHFGGAHVNESDHR